MRSRVMVVLLVAAVGLPAAEAGAQDMTLADGARLRVQAPLTGRTGFVTGTLVAHDSDQLTLLAGDDGQVVVDRRQVTKLEISSGRNRKKAACIGAGVGTAVAGALVLAGARGVGCNESECLCSGSGCLTAFAILGVPAAVLGSATGALVAPERWHPVSPGTPRPNARALLSRSVGPVRLSVVRGGGQGPGIGFEAGLSF